MGGFDSIKPRGQLLTGAGRAPIMKRDPRDFTLLPTLIIEPTQMRDPSLPEDRRLEARISAVLMRHYPGHPWMVWVRHSQGVAIIKNPKLDLRTVYVLHTMGRYADVSDAAIMRAAGEMLERARIRRGVYDPELYRGARMERDSKPNDHAAPRFS